MSQVWGKETTPSVPEPQWCCKGRKTLVTPKEEGGCRGRRPGRLSCPEPWGLCRDTPSPGPGRCHHHRRQAVTFPELRRGTKTALAGRGRGQRKGFSAAGPGNRLRLQRCSGTDTNPRGRHDGLGAAPQRGQAPPSAPPPATSGARLAGTGMALASLSRDASALPGPALTACQNSARHDLLNVASLSAR